MLVATAKEQGHCVFLTGQDDAEAAAEAALGVNWIPLVEKERMQGRAGRGLAGERQGMVINIALYTPQLALPT